MVSLEAEDRLLVPSNEYKRYTPLARPEVDRLVAVLGLLTGTEFQELSAALVMLDRLLTVTVDLTR